MKEQSNPSSPKGMFWSLGLVWLELDFPVGLEACPSGNGRFDRLWKSVRNGADAPPADLRYLKKGKALLSGEGFNLQSLFILGAIVWVGGRNITRHPWWWCRNHVGLPDMSKEPTDAYVEALTSEGTLQVPAVVCKSAPKPKQKQRKRKHGLDLHVERLPEHSGLPIRHLPPGNMRDYYEQFRALDEVGHNISFSTFWRCWKIECSTLTIQAAFEPFPMFSMCPSQINAAGTWQFPGGKEAPGRPLQVAPVVPISGPFGILAVASLKQASCHWPLVSHCGCNGPVQVLLPKITSLLSQTTMQHWWDQNFTSSEHCSTVWVSTWSHAITTIQRTQAWWQRLSAIFWPALAKPFDCRIILSTFFLTIQYVKPRTIQRCGC